MKSLKKKNVPWCLLFLVTCTTVCHITVLVGNYKFADTLEKVGSATSGWSGVGLRLSHSLQHELDEIMVNVSSGILDAINHTMHTSKILNTVTSLAGIAADHIEKSHATKAVALLQQHMVLAGGPLGLLPDLLTSSVDKLLDMLLKKAIDMLDLLMKKLKPVLEAVGRFIIKFGDKIQQVISGFSITLDNVQKLFDQVMSAVSSTGKGEAKLEHETFNLFDVSDTGSIGVKDLKNVAKIYSVSAFQGDKAEEMIKRHDKNGDGQIDRSEFNAFVNDPSLPNLMSVLLRSYAKRLAEEAATVGAARLRDEVAERVVGYLELVAAKNLTKLGWVSQALANGSLPLDFTADVLAQLSLSADDPDRLTTADVGGMVVKRMMTFNPQQVAKAFTKLSNTTYWMEEGFHPSEQAPCLKRVTAWMTSAAVTSSSPQAAQQHLSLLSKLGGHDEKSLTIDSEVIASMPEIAFQLAEKNMKAHTDREEAKEEQMHNAMFASKSSRMMLAQLMGGSLATDGTSSEGERLVKSGRPALPITLLWASWLKANATATANRFQHMCFNYSKKSSNAVDSFANMIKGMVKKIQGFIHMMKRYSTPAGIKLLEQQVETFAAKAGKDVVGLIKRKFGGLVNKSAPLINKAVNKAVDNVGESLGHTIGSALGTPLGEALAPALQSILGAMANSNSSALSGVAADLSKIVGKEISSLSGDLLGHEMAKLLHTLINTMMSKATTLLNSTAHKIPGLDQIEAHVASQTSLEDIVATCNAHASRHLARAAVQDRSSASVEELNKEVGDSLRDTQAVLAGAAQKELLSLDLRHLRDQGEAGQDKSVSISAEGALLDEGDNEMELSGIWEEVVVVLRSLSNIMPQAAKTLKFARMEVSHLASGLDGLFKPFVTMGPDVFNEFSALYRVLWTVYFFVMVPLTLFLVFYGFWAGGFFGGPGNHWIEEDAEDTTPEEEKGIWWRIQTCGQACCHCCHGCHDMGFSFWSVLIVMQLFVVLIFVVVLILLILGAVKIFITAGCEQIYILGDQTICGQTLGSLRSFVNTFLAELKVHELPDFCMKENLLVCGMIKEEMQSSAILSMVFGFLSAVISFQLLVESATLHTRAVMRRKYVRTHANPDDDKDQ